MAQRNHLPTLSHVLETCIYVKDVQSSASFYKDTLNIIPFIETPRITGFSLGSTTLLLFQLGGTSVDINTANGTIPHHGPSPDICSLLSSGNKEKANSLKQHFCFAVNDPEEVGKWDAHLQQKGVKILGRMKWERGGQSVYFEDPDANVVEIGSKGIWPHY